eukprot:441297_1
MSILNIFVILKFLLNIVNSATFVQCGQTISGIINQSEILYYYFHVGNWFYEAYDVNINSCSSDTDLFIHLLDIDSNDLSDTYCSNGDSCGVCSNNVVDYMENFTIPSVKTGLYYIEIKPYGANSGGYQIDIKCRNSSWITSVPGLYYCGQTISDIINTSEILHYPFLIGTTYNDVYDVNINSCSSDTDLFIHLLDIDSNDLSDTYCSNGDSCGVCSNNVVYMENFTIPAMKAGLYYIEIEPHGANSGDYQVDIKCVPGINTETVEPTSYPTVAPTIASECTFTNETTNTCYISITFSDDTLQQIRCHHNYSNCIVNIDTMINGKSIHCPSNDCSTCVIYANAALWEETIHGHNCALLTIILNDITLNDFDMIPTNMYKNTIYAPGNGGTLIIPTFLGSNNKIYPSQGTQNIIIISHLSQGYLRYDQNLIIGPQEGILNYTISGTLSTQRNTVTCGKKCNIKCLSSTLRGSCMNMEVNAVNGTSAVDWYCNPLVATACQNSNINCGPKYNQVSPWMWTHIHGWYYQTSDCVANWGGLPSISCTFTSDEGCFISLQNNPQLLQNIECDQKYVKCDVQTSGAIFDRMDFINLPLTYNSYNISCPTNSACRECKISCLDSDSCSGVTIFGNSCKLLSINILSSFQSNMIIYAPGNGGTLTVTFGGVYHFLAPGIIILGPVIGHSKIYSTPGTHDMILDFSKCGNCVSSYIDGTHVTNEMNVICTTEADCESDVIICPNDAKCNVNCSSMVIGACRDVIVYAQEGTHDVRWICDNHGLNNYLCRSSFLECDNGTSNWIYNYTENQWDLVGDCVDLPSEAPTPSPTVMTFSPTISPSTAPTFSPTTSPTSAPNALYETFGMANKGQFYGLIIGSIMACLLCSGSLLWCIYYYKRKPRKIREKQTMYIKNGCVILICIGEYDDIVSDAEIDGYLSNLDNQQDAENMLKLFHDKLNYDVFPYNIDTDGNRYFESNWKANDLTEFLEEKANYLEANINDGKRYDGLIVIISCHGIDQYICTSEYKKYSKSAIHRIFSWKHPLTRSIARFFLYDCCAGSHMQAVDISDDEKDQRTETGKYGKVVELTDIDAAEKQAWSPGQDNPD